MTTPATKHMLHNEIFNLAGLFMKVMTDQEESFDVCDRNNIICEVNTTQGTIAVTPAENDKLTIDS
jgi:hypothetical protein